MRWSGVALCLMLLVLSAQTCRQHSRNRFFDRFCDGKPSPIEPFTIQAPSITLLADGGLQIAYPDSRGISLFAVHYSVNTAIADTAVGTYNFDVTSKTAGWWVHENKDLGLTSTDTVYYWIYILNNGRGYQLLNRYYVPQVVKPGTLKGPKCSSYPCLIFEDEFDDLNFDTWEHEISMGGGGNWEFQYYTNNRSNSYTHDGTLFIKPTLTAEKYGENYLSSGTIDLWGMAPPNLCTGNAWFGCLRTGTASNYLNPVQSARLRSVYSFNFRYGKVEIEAQMPQGDWLWPALWLLPKNEAYGGWPASGEIDIVESKGNLNLVNDAGVSVGRDDIGSTLHWGPYWPHNGWSKTTGSKHGDWSERMHRYGLEWTDESIRITVDDEEVLLVEPPSGGFWELGDFGLGDANNPWRYSDNQKMAPFDKEFYIIMNLAVGGTNGFFHDGLVADPPKPWENSSPTAMKDFWEGKDDWYPTWNPDVNNGESAALKVNYVRVWKLQED